MLDKPPEFSLVLGGPLYQFFQRHVCLDQKWSWCRVVLALFRQVRPPEQGDYQLTPHELRLLRLIVEGHSYKTAAAKLNVSTKTISFHLQRIYEKLQVHSKSEAVAKAFRKGLV